MIPPLLVAQLRRYLAPAPEEGLSPEALLSVLAAASPEQLAALLEDVGRAYRDGEHQNARLHRALEISTREAEDLAAALRRDQAVAEDARQASEGRFRAIMELLPDIVSLLEPDGTLAYNSPACTRIHGWAVDELAGQQTFHLIHPDERDRVAAAMTEVLGRPGGVMTVQYRYQNKDGTYVWMEATAANQCDDPSVHGVIAVSRDISERRAVEERLRESEARYRNLSDLLPIPAFESDPDGRLLFANRAFVTIFGPAAAAAGAHLLDLFTPEAAPVVARHLARPDLAATLTDELVGRHADGTTFPVEFTSTAVLTASGPTGLRGAMLDLTDRHRVQTEMVRAQKLESIGLLAGGIAHDFNNILTGIRGNVSLAANLAGSWGPLQDVLAETERATERATELTRQLLTFARGGAPTLKPVPVERLCHEVTSFVLRGSSVRAELAIDADIPDLLADEGQIGQALGNLVLNAREAMPNGGRIRIHASTVRAPAAPTGPPAAPRVRITVADDGHGIPASVLPHIFDPYVTTKSSGHGLGLASAYSIVRRHGGELRVDSPPGRGATFELLLPAAPERAVPPPCRPTPGALPQLSGRILVMDDEPMIRRLVQSTLTRVGLAVDACVDGTEAISAYDTAAAEGHPYDLVIMDLTIPGGLGGREAAEAIHARHPDARLIVSSGYSDDPVMADHEAHGFLAAVPKPYGAATLISAVHTLLTAPR